VETVLKIREMAIVNPEERVSVAQMLVKYFDRIGLSTPRNQVPALTSSPYPTIASAPPTLTTRTTKTRRRGL
jgi:hypothetical protein